MNANDDISKIKFKNLLKQVCVKNINHDVGGGTLLYHACNNSWIKETHLLLKYGADHKVSSSNTPSPIWIAAQRGCLQIVELLHMHKADVNQCHNSLSPLMVAVAHGKEKVIRYLLANGAKTELTDEELKTVLHRACLVREKGMIEIIDQLVQAGADVNAVSRNGVTPTMLAAEMGNVETLKILVNAGADIYRVSKYGNAYDFAMRNRNKLTCQFLSNRMSSNQQKKDVIKGEATIGEAVTINSTGGDEARMKETSISKMQINFHAQMEEKNIVKNLTMDHQAMTHQDIVVSYRMKEEDTENSYQTLQTLSRAQAIFSEDMKKLEDKFMKFHSEMMDTQGHTTMKNQTGIVWIIFQSSSRSPFQ